MNKSILAFSLVVGLGVVSARASTWEPGSQQDCLTYVCGETRECRFVEADEACVEDAPTCDKSLACSYAGHCGDAGEGYCVATSEASCTASRLCALEGLCGYAPEVVVDGVVKRAAACVQKEPMACRRSSACKREGRCTFTGARCMVRSSADCRASARCKSHGECVYRYYEGGYAIHRCGPLVQDGYDPAPQAADDAEPSNICSGLTVCGDYGGCHWDGKRCASTPPLVKPCAIYAPIAVQVVSASSVHPAIEGFDFGPMSLVDDDPRTSWQPAARYGGGARVRLRFVFEAPVAVARMRIRNGFQFTDKRFGDLFIGNNRVEHLAIWRGPPASLPEGPWVDDAYTGLAWHAVALDYAKRGEQVVELHGDVMSEVNLEIVDIAHGTKWNDLAISDLRFERCVTP